MEGTNQDIHLDPPSAQQGPFHRPHTPHRAMSPISTCSEVTIKPYQPEPPAYTNVPYLDNLSLPYHDSSPTGPDSSCSQPQQRPLIFHIPSPTNYPPPTIPSSLPSYSEDGDDDDVPLAQLLLYHRDAPPAYSTVVRHSYRETLLQHIPRYPVAMDTDEEAALEGLRADDVRFTIERVVAMAVVTALLMLSGLLAGLLFIRN